MSNSIQSNIIPIAKVFGQKYIHLEHQCHLVLHIIANIKIKSASAKNILSSLKSTNLTPDVSKGAKPTNTSDCRLPSHVRVASPCLPFLRVFQSSSSCGISSSTSTVSTLLRYLVSIVNSSVFQVSFLF